MRVFAGAALQRQASSTDAMPIPVEADSAEFETSGNRSLPQRPLDELHDLPDLHEHDEHAYEGEGHEADAESVSDQADSRHSADPYDEEAERGPVSPATAQDVIDAPLFTGSDQDGDLDGDQETEQPRQEAAQEAAPEKPAPARRARPRARKGTAVKGGGTRKTAAKSPSRRRKDPTSA